MHYKAIRIAISMTAALFLASCAKEVPPELLSKNQNKQQSSSQQNQQEMPDDSIHRSLKSGNPHTSGSTEDDSKKGEGWNDEKVIKLTKEADEADAKFRKTGAADDKSACIEKQMAAANYLMFEADLPPKDKYKPALQRYRRILEIDPKNDEAMTNKKQIEDIYISMGKPIPE
jgi:hypothetical protein